MKFVLFALGSAMVVVIAMALMANAQTRGDSRRRQQQRASLDAGRRKAERARLIQEVRAYFPDVIDESLVQLEATDSLDEALGDVLAGLPGTRLGEMKVRVADQELFLPAVWASKQRCKHGYIVGRTGSGKTTLLVRCAKADIDAGHAVCVMAPERELFLETLLPLCGNRADDTIYFAPGDPRCTIRFNPLSVEPGDDPGRCAAELYKSVRGVFPTAALGSRTAPILANAFAAVVCWPQATLLEVKRFLEDSSFRKEVLSRVSDPYVLGFWSRVYVNYPAGAHIPAVNLLDSLLRYSQLRVSLCSGSGFSVRRAIAEKRILLVDLGGLDPDSMLLIGRSILGRIMTELLRRETSPAASRVPYFLYCDEFQTTAGAARDDWRAACSRGRRYGLAVTLANQFPSQLPVEVKDEILANFGSIFAFSLGSKDADAIRKELLYRPEDGSGVRPVPLESLVDQRVGSAVAKLGSASVACALRVAPPVEVPPREVGDRVREGSWRRFGSVSVGPEIAHVVGPTGCRTGEADSTVAPVSALSEAEVRFLAAVVENPGQPSAEYAKLTGLNGSRAARVRKTLVERGLVREHKLARKARGKPAVILEPLEPAHRVVAAADGTRS